MIPKRIDRTPGSDNYRALALYIADAAQGKTSGEKTLFSWYSGGLGDTANYWQGLEDVELVQAMNQRTGAGKTYHLMVSFRPEDEDKLTEEVLREIEGMLASALGFDEHQRHCGVHQNTANLHMHMSFNMIHPQTYNRHAPYRDNYKLSRVCREIERKYGLVVDNGAEPDAPRREGQANSKVQAIEAQTGRETLFSYVIRHKLDILDRLGLAKSWTDVHTVFLQYGLSLVPAGNGLKIKDRYGKHHVKPSVIDRQLGKGPLCARFGPYVEAGADLVRSIKSAETYSGVPIQIGPERDGLYAAFKDEMEHRRKAIAEINDEGRRLYDDCKKKWAEKRRAIRKIPLLRHDRERLREEIRRREIAELDQLRAENARKRNAVRETIPYTSWNQCLQHKAARGNETALAILRSKKELVKPEIVTPYSTQAFTSRIDSFAKHRAEIKDSHGLSEKHCRALFDVIKMREAIAKGDFPGVDENELKYSIDAKGTIIYSLPDGGRIRDSGRAIHFTSHSRVARTLALQYAGVKWGQNAISSEGAVITRNSYSTEQKKAFEKIIDR